MSFEADLHLLKTAALAAGQLAMTFFRRNPATWSKSGGSPVTEADMAVDTLLGTALRAQRPGYGWLSEETADNSVRLERDTVFIVDPIDGTRGFIEGDDRWCVSVAVVHEGRPVVGVLYAPARDAFYTAVAGEGAWSGDKRLVVSTRRDLRGARLAGPRGWLKSRALTAIDARIQSHVPSLAFRLASVATDTLDAAFASPGAHDWDLAASDLLVHEAGGRLTDLDGNAPCYNREAPHHGVLAATNMDLLPGLLGALGDAGRERARAGLPR